MKLMRFGNPGEERAAIELVDGTRVPLKDGVDYDTRFFAAIEEEGLEAWIDRNQDEGGTVPQGVRIAAPLTMPSKIICIGLNYRDHAEESGMALPPEPVVFFKASTALCGPNDNLIIPDGSEKTDWEVELAVVIGKKATHVSEAEAMDYVFGYALHNDYSERAYQLERGGQWVKGKSYDSFAPLGPTLVTRDEIEWDNLELWLSVNGKQMQRGHTRNMVYGVPHLVSYLSQFMTLLPGDVISTGTPAGVGLGFDPPIYLKAGDVVELGIDGLGTSRQKAVNRSLLV